MSKNTRFEKARFHIAYGPKALFDRVFFKMKDVNQLKLSAEHFDYRVKTRCVPSEVMNRIKQFNMNDWNLVCCEVRIDKGKFVNSTWETVYNGKRYWITIGFNNVIETVIYKDSSGTNGIVKSGDLYDFVDEVNKRLMNEETVNA